MGPRNLPYLLVAAGLVAAVAMSRRQPNTINTYRPRIPIQRRARSFVLESDLPGLELRRGERLRIEPDALIRLGDVVALKGEQAGLVLARYHDELMHCVAGLVVREAQEYSAI